MGLDRFVALVTERLAVKLEPARAVCLHLDRRPARLGAGSRTAPRTSRCSSRTAAFAAACWTGLHAIAELDVGRFIMTPNQNLVLADIPARARRQVDALLAAHGLDRPVGGLRRNAMACVALPTCGLALAESERYLPT